MESIWKEVKSAIKKDVPDHSYRMWIEPLGIKKGTNGDVILTCPNLLFKKRIQNNYAGRIESQMTETMGKTCNLQIEVVGRNGASGPETGGHLQLPLPNPGNRPHMGRMLRKDFTFDHFVVGKNNDFAYCAALSLASKRHQHQNTLYLLSKTGLGKSHLSQATGHHILTEHPKERVYYITAEDFTNEMIGAFRHSGLEAFKRKYRDGCDVLLMEDIHYLTGKERTQVELALTLEFLIEANKKIIFSSCYLPADIPKLSDKLRSCLSSGIISTIEPPDFKTRVRILKKKCQVNGHRMPEDVLYYLASELTDDVRQLESGIIGVTARSSLLGSAITLGLAENVVKNITRVRSNITIDAIKKLVCNQFKISLADVVSRSRKQCFVKPRQIAIYLSRRYTDSPLQTIGKSFNRYHATALHSIAVVERDMKTDPATKKQVAYLCGKLEAGKF